MAYDIGHKQGLVTLIENLKGLNGIFECECGERFETRTAEIRRGLQSCGCAGVEVSPGTVKGRWTIVRRDGMETANKRKRLIIKCLCNKNYTVSVSSWEASSFPLHSCPLEHPMIGQRFGRLTIVEPLEERLRENIQFRCECDCGQSHVAISAELRRGTVRSCGCLQRETAAARAKAKYPKSEGYITYGYAHTLVREARGSATEHVCPCGKPADEWSYNGDCPNELVGRDNFIGYKYSRDPWAYTARCRECHIRFDARKVA